MTTKTNEEIVKEVVAEFIQNKWSFTAYNITTEAKKRGATDRHNALKGIVHAMYLDDELPGYSRTTTTVPGSSAKPFLYKSDASADDGDAEQDDSGVLLDPADDDGRGWIYS